MFGAAYSGFMRRSIPGFLVLFIGIFSSGCNRQTPAMQFDKLTRGFSLRKSGFITSERHRGRIPRQQRRAPGRAPGRLQRRRSGPAANLLQGFPAPRRQSGRQQARQRAARRSRHDEEQCRSGAAGARYDPELQAQSRRSTSSWWGTRCSLPTCSTMRPSRSASSRSPSVWKESPRCSSKPRPTWWMRRKSGIAWRAKRTTETSS